MRQLFEELKRRNVYKVAVTYAAVAFVGFQAVKLLIPSTTLPPWADELLLAFLIAGFPVAVVVAWAFEMTPEGVRRTADAEGVSDPESMPLDERRAQSRLAMKALVGLGLVGAAVAGGWYLMGGGGESPEIDEQTVAVVPFQVSGSGADAWRDGMVTMLTTKLDGAGGLRAISDRTVFAAWEGSAQAQGGASTEEALTVARKVGAEYAVVGSAVQLADELQLTASVHETRSGSRVGQVEVAGSPDSVTALTDSLARRTLGILASEIGRGSRSADVASLTTRSLPALQAYLEGERHFRAGEYDQAIRDYRTAIEHDSTFALARTRFAYALNWGGSTGFPDVSRSLERASEFSSHLPPRERRILRARRYYYGEGRMYRAADSLRALADAYPDDPRIWYSLGESLFHGQVPGGWPEAESAFERAVELEPEVAAYHHHLVDLAMALHNDSALAARRISAHPAGIFKSIYETLWGLNFGSAERKGKARARLDTLPAERVAELALDALAHPTDLELQGQVLDTLLNRRDPESGVFLSSEKLAINRLLRGKVQAALPLLPPTETVPTCPLAAAASLGYPVPDSVLRARLEPSRIPDGAAPDRFFCAGVHLITEGRDSELSSLIGRLERAGQPESEDESLSQFRDDKVMVNELRAYQAWVAGDALGAVDFWSQSKPLWWPVGGIWRGDGYRKLGRMEKAQAWYVAAWPHPVAHERLGQLYEEMGKPEKAAAAYRRFIAAWEDADPELQDRVEEARKRLQELTGSGADSDG